MAKSESEIMSPEEISVKLYRYDHIAEPIQGYANWNAEQLANYRRDGFVPVEHVLNEDEIESSKLALHDLIFKDLVRSQNLFKIWPTDPLRMTKPLLVFGLH